MFFFTIRDNVIKVTICFFTIRDNVIKVTICFFSEIKIFMFLFFQFLTYYYHYLYINSRTVLGENIGSLNTFFLLFYQLQILFNLYPS